MIKTKEEIAEIQRIVDGAPEGATHVAWNGDYWCLSEDYNPRVYLPNREEWFLVTLTHQVQELNDLRTIIAQQQEIERWKAIALECASMSTRQEACEYYESQLLKGESDE